MQVPPPGPAISPQVGHPSPNRSGTQKISIIAIRVILTVLAGKAVGSLLGIGGTYGTLGVLIICAIALNCPRKRSSVKAKEVADKTLLPVLPPPNSLSANLTTNSLKVPLVTPRFVHTLHAYLISLVPTNSPLELNDNLNHLLLRLNRAVIPGMLEALKNIKSKKDFNDYLIPLFHQYKDKPESFLFLAIHFGIHIEQNYKVKGGAFGAIYEALNNLEWPSLNLKLQELPYILCSSVSQSVPCLNEHIRIMDNDNHTLCHSSVFNIYIDNRVLCFFQSVPSSAPILAKAIGLFIQHMAHQRISEWMHDNFATLGIAINFLLPKGQNIRTVIAPFLPEIAKLPGMIRSLKWSYTEMAQPFNKPFQLEGQDGFCDADIESLLAIARRNPYLRCVWNGSQMSSAGFKQFSEELSQIIEHRIHVPTKEQLLEPVLNEMYAAVNYGRWSPFFESKSLERLPWQ